MKRLFCVLWLVALLLINRVLLFNIFTLPIRIKDCLLNVLCEVLCL